MVSEKERNVADFITTNGNVFVTTKEILYRELCFLCYCEIFNSVKLNIANFSLEKSTSGFLTI